MSYPLTRLEHDIAQVQHKAAMFGTGRLVAEDLVLTAAHVLWKCKADREAGVAPALDGWQVRFARDHDLDALSPWPFRNGNRVVWHDPARDLALIRLMDPEGDPLRPVLRLRVAAVEGNNPHAVEARGYPCAAKEEDQRYRELTPALGRVTAGDRHRPLRFGVDSCDLPNQPHADWPGMSGSAVLLQDWPDVQTIWLYGVVQEVPANFDGQLRVARLADAWQHDARFRKLLVQAGADDEDAADPTTVALPNQERSFAPFAGVPVHNTGFTGRDAELDRLDAVLLGGKPAAVTQAAGSPAAGIERAAVLGLGGVGKTSLAVEYAHRYRAFYAGVWWCPAQTRLGLLTSLARLAGELGAAREAEVERAAKAGLRCLERQRTPFLLVYDNVVSPNAIADLLPASGARVLITSRFPDWGGWAEEVALDVLPPAEAVTLLQKRAKRQDEAGATLLADALGRLPLALDHAAAYCLRTQMRFIDYAARARSLIETVPNGASYPRSVAATFSLAIAEAVERCPAAHELMAYLAQCGPERIPFTLIEGALASQAKRDLALGELVDMSLVTHSPFEDGTPAIIVHRLVQVVARTQAQTASWVEWVTATLDWLMRAITSSRTKAGNMRFGSRRAAKNVVKRLLNIYPKDAYDSLGSWPLCAQLTPHLITVCYAGWVGSLQRTDLAERAARYLHRRAAYRQAEELLRSVWNIRRKLHGIENPRTVSSLTSLALLYKDQGKRKGAQRVIECATLLYARMTFPNDPEISKGNVTHLSNFAWLRREQGDLSAARRLYESALFIREKTLNPEHSQTAEILNDLALVRRDQGHLDAALLLHKRALAMCEKVLTPEHPDTARSLNNLASLLRAQGDLAEARPLFERALAIRERTLGPEHPDTAQSLNDFANLLRDEGDLAKARPLFERALAIRERTLGPEHPDTATIRSSLALSQNASH